MFTIAVTFSKIFLHLASAGYGFLIPSVSDFESKAGWLRQYTWAILTLDSSTVLPGHSKADLFVKMSDLPPRCRELVRSGIVHAGFGQQFAKV